MTSLNHPIQSENIGDLITALAKAQSEIESAAFDKVNPHFKSKYASYDSIRETCRLPLAKNGLAITHHLDNSDGKRILITQLSHASGQWMRSFVSIPQERETPQSLGSAITYSKRYALSAFLAIGSDEDDDGEAAETTYRTSSRISKTQAQEIEEICGDPEMISRILKAYKVTDLTAINVSEYQTIIKRIKLTRGKENENTGS